MSPAGTVPTLHTPRLRLPAAREHLHIDGAWRSHRMFALRNAHLTLP